MPRARAGGKTGEHEVVAGTVAEGVEDLAAIDDVLVALDARGGRQLGERGARVGLRHGDRALRLPGGHATQHVVVLGPAVQREDPRGHVLIVNEQRRGDARLGQLLHEDVALQ